MKSPFPGMDPYLEAHWGDVHATLIVYAKSQLNAMLPKELQARVEESLAVREAGRRSRSVFPDIQIVEEPPATYTQADPATGTTSVIVPKPYAVRDELPTLRHIEIVDTEAGGRVVTAVEILGPANKMGIRGAAAYLRKQEEYLSAGVNLVEIDLIRAGGFVLAIHEDCVPDECQTPYLICIRRASRPDEAELYPAPLAQPLPNIPIPLRTQDQDVVLQLQPLIDDCYRDGRYDRLDYSQAPVPALNEVDARWADELLRQHGLRT